MYKAQYAFNVSMIMCPAVHMATRSLLRSSSTHEPSDPLSRVKITLFYSTIILFLMRCQHTSAMPHRTLPLTECCGRCEANMNEWATLAKSFRNQQHVREDAQSHGKYQGFYGVTV